MPIAVEKFTLGRVVVTPSARDALTSSGEDVGVLLNRHATGDWGGVDPEDAVENEIAVQFGLRVVSIYSTCLNYRIYVVTEADRSGTTVMLPEES